MLQSWTNAVTGQVVGDRSPPPHHRRGGAPRHPAPPHPRLLIAATGARRAAHTAACLRVGSLSSEEIQDGAGPEGGSYPADCLFKEAH